MRPAWDVVWFSDIPWAGLRQRPQHLAVRFPPEAEILFVEPCTLGHTPALLPQSVAPRVRRLSFPFLPLHARSHRLRRAAYRIGDSAAGAGAVLAVQRLASRCARGAARRGSRRLALVQNFLAYPFLSSWSADRVVYDMIDAPLHFAPHPPRLVRHWEALLRRADRVAVTSAALAALAREGGALDPVLVGNGVEAARFRDAPPARLPGDPGSPVLGYVGSLHAWLDVPLVESLARALPGARVVLVGPAHPDTAAALARVAREAPNLHWIGPRPYEEIPSIVGAFRVGLIPFRRTPLTEAVNPVKLYEYAAAGVPTVTTRFTDEADRWSDAARVTDTPERFIDAVRSLLDEPRDPGRLRAFAARHDWDAIGKAFVAICLEEAA